MTENQAIELALGFYRKHILPGENRESMEVAIIQNIADLYRNGYEVSPAKKCGDIMGDSEIRKEITL